MAEELLSPNNRIDYGKSLIPDEGWVTSWAIGTTYSLDLEVLLAIPLALFHGVYTSEATNENNLRTDMLDALEKVKQRMFIFVHENNITAKSGYSMLMGFLDQNIRNVPMDSPNKNFHPKVWLVRYEKKNSDSEQRSSEYRYRLVTMSRNITSATDFDIAVTMDCVITEKEHSNNASLVAMMSTLMEKTGRKDIIKQLERELKHVRFTPPYPFSQNGKPAIFWPHTFENFKSPLLENKEYDRLLVISPFIDNDTLNLLQKRCTRTQPILVSREFEMDKCEPDKLSKWDCYAWNSMLEEAESYEEDEGDSKSKKSHSISLHAKIFIAEARYDYDKKVFNHWFVGSTNCTKAGLESNFEAQLQLRSSAPETSVDKVFESLLKSTLIKKYEIKEHSSREIETDKNKREQRELIYALSHLDFKGEILKMPGEKYATKVSCNPTKRGIFNQNYGNSKVNLTLFASELDIWDIGKEPSHEFQEIYCQQLSTFLKASVRFENGDEKDFLMQIPMEIPEERHGRIMSEILDSEEKVMRYLMFCLDAQMDREQQKIGKEIPSHHTGSESNSKWSGYSLPIYEKLLLAASRNKAALKNIQKIVDKLQKAKDKKGKPMLSKEFKDMWKLFTKYAK